jgi:hypothetical protein
LLVLVAMAATRAWYARPQWRRFMAPLAKLFQILTANVGA